MSINGDTCVARVAPEFHTVSRESLAQAIRVAASKVIELHDEGDTVGTERARDRMFSIIAAYMKTYKAIDALYEPEVVKARRLKTQVDRQVCKEMEAIYDRGRQGVDDAEAWRLVRRWRRLAMFYDRWITENVVELTIDEEPLVVLVNLGDIEGDH